MNRRLIRDLQAWEAGKVSLSVLNARYPGQQVGRVTDLFLEMRSLAEEPSPDATRGWNLVRSRMAAHVERQPAPLLARFKPGLQRRLAFGLAAAVLAVPPVALAATNDGVRTDVTSFVVDVTDTIFGNPTETAIGQNVGGDPVGSVGTGFSNNGDGSGQSVGTVPGGSAPKQSTVAPSGTAGKDVAQVGTATDPLNGPSVQPQHDGRSGGTGSSGNDGSGTDAQGNDGADASPSPTPSPSLGADGSTAQGQDSASSPNTPSVSSTQP